MVTVLIRCLYQTSFDFSFLFLFNDTATTDIYTLSLHDALPISTRPLPVNSRMGCAGKNPRNFTITAALSSTSQDRKSTRLNSSHVSISYAVFCLKKKKHTPSSRDLVNR